MIALPAMRHEFPAACRVRVGEFDGRKPVRRFHFDIAAELEGGDDSGAARYHTHPALMQELARSLGYGTEEHEGKVRILKDGQPTKFEPRRIPIELLSDKIDDFLTVRLARWRRSGPDCTSLSSRRKTGEEVAVAAQQKALAAQGLPTEPTEGDFAYLPELWVGECEQTQYTEKTADGKKFLVQSGRVKTICDPLTCPHFRSADPKAFVPCKPEIDFRFRLPWTGQRSWARFCSTSWATARLLLTTLADIKANCGDRLRGVPCLLVTEPRKVRTPDGTRQKQPVVYVAYDRPVQELRAGVQTLLALEQGQYNPQLALPPPLAESPARARAIVQEFHPEAEAEDVQILGFEDDWARRANAAGATPAWIETKLADTDGDEEFLEAELHALTHERPQTENANGQGRLL